MSKTALVVLALYCFLVSCDTNRVFEENTAIPDNVWNYDNKVSFEVPVTDTVSYHNFYVNVRHADGYPYRNLYLFISTFFPDGRSSRDTMECIFQDDNGQWLGDGLGDLYDNQIPYKRNVKFPKPGNYRFEIEQAMRVKQLPLIMDVGFRIEKK